MASYDKWFRWTAPIVCLVAATSAHPSNNITNTILIITEFLNLVFCSSAPSSAQPFILYVFTRCCCRPLEQKQHNTTQFWENKFLQTTKKTNEIKYLRCCLLLCSLIFLMENSFILKWGELVDVVLDGWHLKQKDVKWFDKGIRWDLYYNIWGSHELNLVDVEWRVDASQQHFSQNVCHVVIRLLDVGSSGLDLYISQPVYTYAVCT